jgi:hypothetical protein
MDGTTVISTDGFQIYTAWLSNFQNNLTEEWNYRYFTPSTLLLQLSLLASIKINQSWHGEFDDFSIFLKGLF